MVRLLTEYNGWLIFPPFADIARAPAPALGPAARAMGCEATREQGETKGTMNSEQLRYFELAYTERNFTAAAKLVPVSPQGLTKAIRSLEKELGVELFTLDSETGKPVPTAYAQELYEFTSVFHSNLRLLNESLDRLRGLEQRTIRLGCSAGVLGAFGPELIDSFEKTHPHVKVAFWESYDRQCEQDLIDGKCDIAMLVGNEVSQGCEGVKIYESPVYFWMKRADPLVEKVGEHGVLHIEDLEGRSVAIPGRGYVCFENLNRVADEHGVRLDSVVEISEIFRLFNYAAKTDNVLGFANGTLIDVPVFNPTDQIVALPIAELTWGFFLEHERHHALDESERALWNWCLNAARALPYNDVAQPGR